MVPVASVSAGMRAVGHAARVRVVRMEIVPAAQQSGAPVGVIELLLVAIVCGTDPGIGESRADAVVNEGAPTVMNMAPPGMSVMNGAAMVAPAAGRSTATKRPRGIDRSDHEGQG